MARKLLLLAALAVLATCAGWLRAEEAAAQSTTCKTLVPRCVNQAPYVTLDPPVGTSSSSYMAVRATVHDESGIKPTSFLVKLNGVVLQSGGATAGATYAVNMALTLAPGQNVLEVSACDTADLCGSNEGIYWYVAQPPPDSFAVATVSLEPYTDGLRMTSPFDAAAAYGTPAYVSQDVQRSVVMVYDGGQAQARSMITIDAVDRSTVAPTRMSLQVLDAAGGVVSPERFYQAGSGTNRLAAYWFAPTVPTGAYTYQAVVRTYWDLPGRTVVKQAAAKPVRVLHLNERRSRLGHGWWVAGLQRLHFRGDSALVTNGDGTAAYFTRSTPTAFVKPQGEWSELSRPDSLYLRRWPDGTKAVFSADGYVKHVEDRFGRRTSFHWTMTADGLYRVPSRIVDPVGKEVTFGYHYGNLLGTIVTPGGRTSTVWYDGGRISQIVAPDGVLELAATYGTFDRLRTRTDRGGGTYAFAYDSAGFIMADTFPAVAVEGGGTQRPVVGYAGWESALLPPPGTGTAANPAPRVNVAALRARVTDPRGATTTMAFDRFLFPTRVEEPAGDTTLIFRNHHGQPRSVTLPTGAVTEYQYGFDYQTGGPTPTRIREWGGELDTEVVTTINYEPPFNLPSVVTRGGVSTGYDYGTQGQLLSASRGDYTTSYGYTADWRQAWVDDPTGRRTNMRYDSTGFRNLREVSDLDGQGLGRTVQYTSDAYGRTATMTDASGTVQRRMDALNRDTAVVDPSGTTRLAYQGNFLWKVTDPSGKQYTFNRNPVGWLTSEVYPGGLSTSYGYDARGNTRRATDRRGLSTTFTHDSLGRVLTQTADGATTTFAYGPSKPVLGTATHWVSAANAVSTDTVEFDERGRKVSETTYLAAFPTTRFNRRSSWHPEGMRKSMSYNTPSGVYGGMEFGYGSTLQLERFKSFGQWSELVYNGAGLLDSLRIRVGVATPGPTATFEYSSSHMPTRARWSVSTINGKLGVAYTWDHRDRLSIRENALGTSQNRYGYDAMSQLTSASSYVKMPGEMICEDPMQPSTCFRPMNWTVSNSAAYTYDAVGNRTNAGATMQPSSNRYQTFRGYTFEYDSVGNLTRKHNASYNQTLTWNTLGQLASVTTNGVTVTYGYNGFGQRVKRTTGGTSSYALYDGDDLLMELSGTGALVREYAHYPGVDQPHSMKDASGNVFYYSMEAPGHVNGLFNASNQVVNEYRYDPWGESTVVTEGVQQPLRYMARELDGLTGLYYVRNRWYDPVINRFVSEDPIGLAGGSNPYAFVMNSPTNLLDPTGLEPECKTRVVTVLAPVVYETGETGEMLVRYCAPSYSDDWSVGFLSSLNRGNSHMEAMRNAAGSSWDWTMSMLGAAGDYTSCVISSTGANVREVNTAVVDGLGWAGGLALDMAYTSLVRKVGGGTGLLSPGYNFVRQVVTSEALALGRAGLSTNAAIYPLRGTLIIGGQVTGGVGALAILGEGVVISAVVVGAFELGVGIGSLGQAMVTCS